MSVYLWLARTTINTEYLHYFALFHCTFLFFFLFIYLLFFQVFICLCCWNILALHYRSLLSALRAYSVAGGGVAARITSQLVSRQSEVIAKRV